MSDIMVTVKHIRNANFCSRGARIWFARHGLDFNTFITKGYPVEVIENTGDELGRMVASIARQDAAGELDE
jgi:hypothetical protein